MGICKILTYDDKDVIYDFLALFKEGLQEVRNYCDRGSLNKELAKYDFDYIFSKIHSGSDKRFIAHFSDRSSDNKTGLDGILIEHFGFFRRIQTAIYWLNVSKKRNGIGTQLLKDSIFRARLEGKKYISLSVSKNNIAAYNLYAQLGFRKSDISYGLPNISDSKIIMNYIL